MDLISIGSDSRPLSEADAHWVTQEILGRRRDGQDVCVIVKLDGPNLNLRLATPSCAGGAGGGGRPPSKREAEVIKLWNDSGLNQADFSPGNVISFLKRLGSFL